MTWYEYLEKLNKDRFWSREEIPTYVSERWMQERFPGPYHLYETYDPKRNVIALGLHFKDKEEEIAWKLKWG